MGLLATRLIFVLSIILYPSLIHAAAIEGKEEGSQIGYCKSINFVGGSQTLTTSGLDCTLTTTGAFITSGNIAGQNHHLRLNIPDPDTYGMGEIELVPKLDAAITVTNIEVTCDVNPTTEIDLDLKYADTFIGKANPVVINALDTTDGVLSDSSITSGAVAATKAIYLDFGDTADSGIGQIGVDITFDYD